MYKNKVWEGTSVSSRILNKLTAIVCNDKYLKKRAPIAKPKGVMS